MNKLKSLNRYTFYTMLVICCFCDLQAQTHFKIGDTDYEPILEVSQDSTDVTLVGAKLLTLKLLNKYKKTCYNDSIYVEYWRYNESPSSTDENGHTITYGVYISPTRIKEWQHKTPTFEDFLNWISKNK
jgi:hypothetical protein